MDCALIADLDRGMAELSARMRAAIEFYEREGARLWRRVDQMNANIAALQAVVSTDNR